MTSMKNIRASYPSSIGGGGGGLLALPYSQTNGETGKVVDFNGSSQETTAAYIVADPPYLSSQLKSAEWLHRYGLQSQKLTFDQILQQIGVKRVENFNAAPTGRKLPEKNAANLYQEIQQDNGDRYMLTCRPEKLREFRNRLVRMLTLLRKRLAFLTSGSRRLFGILGEPSVCLVCDCKTSDHRIFNQFQLAVINLLREQVAKIKRFNIIWITNDYEIFQELPIDVTTTTIDQAIDWINKRKQTRKQTSISATCEAILKAFTNTVHSIYLISEGNSSDSAREMLRDNIVKTRLAAKSPIPIHVVSLFCQNNDTETFLRSIAQTADGSFFLHKIQSQITDMKSSSDTTRVKISPAAFEHPIDISLMYKEINQCQNIIDRLEKILGLMRDDDDKSSKSTDLVATKSLDAFNMSQKSTKVEPNLQRSLIIQSSALFNHDENDMASIDWLKIYGVDAQKLDFFSVLQKAAFQQCDGLTNSNASTVSKEKFISAKFCDQFAHVKWPDGTIRHVYVAPEIHRDYERRIRALMEKIKARLQWLKKGSRDVFGTILEKNVYILIDTSRSMDNHLNFVKDKLRLLIQDQLFSKERVNMASFNTVVNPWRDSLTRINTTTNISQLQTWIDGLNAEGSTNTLAALRFAIADSATEGIYLLTDGRPDQNERYILSQIQYRQVIPVHTIAFNCQDQTTNQFLFDLAKQTGGRFHAFNYGAENISSIEIPESEDISYLKQELVYAEKDLQRVADLRDECMSRTWSQENIQTKYSILQTNPPPIAAQLQRQSIVDITLRPTTSPTMPQRIERTKRQSRSLSRKQKSKSAHFVEQNTTIHLGADQFLLPETTDFLPTNGQKSTSHAENNDDDEESSDQVESRQSTRKLPSHFCRVKAYLKKNSLVARGLTIFDVLQPTSVRVRDPQHIQVIDRYVLAKVWDEILPLIYGSYANRFHLVNHYAVDLDKYQVKLKDLITEYHQFTAKFIWKCLHDDDKRKLGPPIYWISLSKEAQYKYAQQITKEDRTDPSALELYAWRQLTDQKQTDLLEKPAIYHEKTAVVLKGALHDAGCESGLQGVARMEVEIKRAIKFLQIANDLRQLQRRADNESKKPSNDPSTTKRKSSSVPRRFGMRVLCRYDADGYFYAGTVQRSSTNRSIVLFDMDIEQETFGHALVPIESNNFLNLFLQDCVLVRLVRETEEYWAPGLILCLPAQCVLPGNLHKVQVFNPYPKQIYAHRQDMVKINLALFQRIVLYLQTIYRNSAGVGTLPTDGIKPPCVTDAIRKILREHLTILTERVDCFIKIQDERYDELQQLIDDHAGVIAILKKRPYKPETKDESAQAERVPTPSTSGSQSTTRKSSYDITIEPGTPVYALWSDDDGLIYEGTILNSIDSHRYRVERKDLPGVQSIISRNDIFLHSNRCLLKNMDIKSFALIEYPNDSRHCFCPSVVRRQRPDQGKTQIRFYDCYQEDIDDNLWGIPLNEEQFERYIQLRIEKELSLINQAIVGFNQNDKCYMLGMVQDRKNTGHLYKIKWSNGSITHQKEEHLFGAFTRRDQHRKGDYVLVMDPNDEIYKLAKTLAVYKDDKRLKIEFLDFDRTGEHPSDKIIDVPAPTTFVITKDYVNVMRSRLK